MLTDVAIIGGTGVGDALASMGGEPIHIPTFAGQLSGRLVPHTSGPLLVVNRHSSGHKVPPHRVNYEAIARGLKSAGVRYCFASAAVGSLRKDWDKGTMVAVSDFIDLSGRHQTLHSRTVVHSDFSTPFPAGHFLIEAGETLGLDVKPSGIYVCENGPRYETPHEIRMLSHVGDVVGMTAATEAVLFRESSFPRAPEGGSTSVQYACLALVTNLAAGITDQPLNHVEVEHEMRKNSKEVVRLFLVAADLARGR
jgi:5'-methylthioadenosine phosphorylase